jgi:hypothetical protein
MSGIDLPTFSFFFQAGGKTLHARAEDFTARDARGESTTLLAAADRLNLDDGANGFGVRILVLEQSIGEEFKGPD